VSSNFSDLSHNKKGPSVVGRPTSLRGHCTILTVDINSRISGNMTFSGKEAEKVTYDLEWKV
jgi:hypothetical protein